MNLLKREDGVIWFHNGLGNATGNEWISAWPTKNFECLGNNKIQVTSANGSVSQQINDWYELLKANNPSYKSIDGIKFIGGLAGHLSYDLGLEQLKISSRHPSTGLPLAVVGHYSWCAYSDHEQLKSWVIIQDDCPKDTIKRIKALIMQPEVPVTEPTLESIEPLDWHCQMAESEYEHAFNEIKNYMLEGDIYQANLTRQWRTEIDSAALTDGLLYERLITQMDAPFSMFHRSQSHSLLSVSPERFIQVEGDKLFTQPIKGTRARGNTKEEDESLKSELAASEKEKAENLMIVDLLRNDLAKSALPGSVKVDKLFEIQTFKNVHHLVSSISAQKKPDTHPLDVLKDAFPGGSITGTPKKRAVQIIDELETIRRGNYCGSSFFLSGDGYLDSNILIRTINIQGDALTCSGGGGIVFDSEVSSEYRESDYKVRRILNSI